MVIVLEERATARRKKVATARYIAYSGSNIYQST